MVLRNKYFCPSNMDTRYQRTEDEKRLPLKGHKDVEVRNETTLDEERTGATSTVIRWD